MELKAQRQYYDERWKRFQYANRLRLARCIALLDGLAATRLYQPHIVDLGCGAGWFTGIIGQFGPTVGVELSEEAVVQASLKHPHVRVVQKDIFNWKYPLNAFDIVVSQEVIEHVPVCKQRQYLEIAYGLLKHDGYLLLTTPNKRTFNAMTEEQQQAWSNQPFENWLEIDELKHLLSDLFYVRSLTTIVPSYGVKNSYRLINSYHLRAILQRTNLADLYDRIRLRLGYGLHMFLLAQKKK